MHVYMCTCVCDMMRVCVGILILMTSIPLRYKV